MKLTCQITCGPSLKSRLLTTPCFQKGFTLIEVLLVMAIFSIGILAIMTLHVTAIKSNAKARRIMMGAIIMGDQFEKLISADYQHPEPDPQEISALQKSGFRVEHTVSATLIPNIKKIDLTVSLDDPSGRNFALTYFKRNPD